MRLVVEGVGAIALGQNDFVARGGEGTVYARDGVAYKVYTDPERSLPVGKRDELAAIADRRVITPQRMLLERGRARGYTMDYLADASPLCRLFPRAFRERHGIDRKSVLSLAEQLRRRIESVHRAGALVVDVNDMNFLVSAGFDTVYAIDCDSYQTKSYAASAITPSVRDLHATKLSELSDWFSFAILAFQLLCGVHPYKGKHRTIHGLEARMRSNASAFDSTVRLPPSAERPEVIPEPLRGWLRAVLQEGKRSLAPSLDALRPVEIRPAVTAATANSSRVHITSIRKTGSVIEQLTACSATLLARTAKALWIDNRRVKPKEELSGQWIATLSPGRHQPIGVQLSGRQITVYDVLGCKRLEVALEADQLALAGHRVFLRNGGEVLELELRDVGSHVIAAARSVARVMPKASRLFEGVVLSNMLGACYASLLGDGAARQVRIPELDGATVLDAKHERGVLMVVATKLRGSEPHFTHRLVLRFDREGSRYDVRIVRDITWSPLSFAVLDTGVCVCLDEEGALELFHARRDGGTLKRLDEPGLPGDTRLVSRGGHLLATRGPEILQLQMR